MAGHACDGRYSTQKLSRRFCHAAGPYRLPPPASPRRAARAIAAMAARRAILRPASRGSFYRHRHGLAAATPIAARRAAREGATPLSAAIAIMMISRFMGNRH